MRRSAVLGFALGVWCVTACSPERSAPGGGGKPTPESSERGSPDAAPTRGEEARHDTAPTTLAGTVRGRPFALASAELSPSSPGGTAWKLSVHNYATDCQGAAEPASVPEPDRIELGVGGLRSIAGTQALRGNDGPIGAITVGVYDDDPEGAKGSHEWFFTATLHLDSWSAEPGSTVSGYLEIATETSSVKGAFVATVCRQYL